MLNKVKSIRRPLLIIRFVEHACIASLQPHCVGKNDIADHWAGVPLCYISSRSAIRSSLDVVLRKKERIATSAFASRSLQQPQQNSRALKASIQGPPK